MDNLESNTAGNARRVEHTSADRSIEEAPPSPEINNDPQGTQEAVPIVDQEAKSPLVDIEIDDDTGDDEDDDGNDGDQEQEEQRQGEAHNDSSDYCDDGLEEDVSTPSEAAVRRPVSIQEFLAWRLMGRIPPRWQLRDENSPRYVPYEEAVPEALPRGPLWQQLHLATGAAIPGVRNTGPHFNTSLDVCWDASMHVSDKIAYGKKIRTEILKAAHSDPRVASCLTLLGPQPTPPPPSPTSTSPTETTPRKGRNDGGYGSGSQSDFPPAPSPSATTTTNTTTYNNNNAGCSSSSYCHSTPSTSRPAAAVTCTSSFPAAPRSPPVTLPPPGYLSGCAGVSAPRLLMRRERGEGGALGGGWRGSTRRHMACRAGVPRYPHAVVDRLDSRAYIGQFSADGQFFVAAFQDQRVRLYDVERGWRLRKDITTRMCRWTITDTSISPDQRFVIYSSIIPVVHLVEVGSAYDSVSSIANITQIHEALYFDGAVVEGEDSQGSFGIWSVQWSGDGREIVAGTNSPSVVVMDVERKRVVARVEGHEDDVNAVTYADDSPNVIVSGSDDTLIKVWDRRLMSAAAEPSTARRHRPVGVLLGHTEGLTHLCARGDGVHVLSNAKDQTAKLWDLRLMKAGGSLRDTSSAARLSRQGVPAFNWDYRWQEYPASGQVVRHPHDSSLQTYRGHSVCHTLIRAYFSPMHTTGGRYIYTGSAEGAVHVYDMLTGQQVEGSPLCLHRKLVRDVNWHPYEPVMATVSWDGTIVRWECSPPPAGRPGLKVPGRDAFNADFF